MATYTNRTCCKCGIRKPQPQMYQREIYVETGKSKTGISGATLFGAFVAGDKKSGTQFRNWMFNNGQRTYKRKKQVWMCGVCAGVQRPAKKVAVEAPQSAAESTLRRKECQLVQSGSGLLLFFWLLRVFLETTPRKIQLHALQPQ